MQTLLIHSPDARARWATHSPLAQAQRVEVKGPCVLWVDRGLRCAHEILIQDARGWLFVRGWLDLEPDEGVESFQARLRRAWSARGARAASMIEGAVVILSWERELDVCWGIRTGLSMIPMTYTRHDGASALSTSPIAALRALGLPVAPRASHLPMALHRDMWSQTTEDALESVWRVRPGEGVCLGSATRRHVQVWSPETTSAPGISPDDARDQLQEVLTQWWRAQRVTDVLSMSAGIDSSTMALMRKAQDSSPEASRVYSMVSPSIPPSDEFPEIKRLAHHAGLEVEGFDLGGSMPVDDALWDEHTGLGPMLHAGMTYERAFLRWMTQPDTTSLVGGYGADETLLCLPALHRRALWQHGGVTLPHLMHPRLRRAMWRQGAVAVARRCGVPAMSRGGSSPKGRALWRDVDNWVLVPDPQTQRAPMPFGDVSLWGHHRWMLTQGWGWEWFARTTWRHMLGLGTRIHSPFLTPKVWETTLRFGPEILMHVDTQAGRLMDKAPLRAILAAHGVGTSLTQRAKIKTFDKVVELSMIQTFGASGTMGYVGQGEHLRRRGLVSRVLPRALDGFLGAVGAPESRRVGSVALWHTLAVERWLEGLD